MRAAAMRQMRFFFDMKLSAKAPSARQAESVPLNEPRLFDRDFVANAKCAGRNHLGIDAAIGVTEPALQRVRDFEIADRGIGIDVDGGAALDPLDDLQADISGRKRAVE